MVGNLARALGHVSRHLMRSAVGLAPRGARRASGKGQGRSTCPLRSGSQAEAQQRPPADRYTPRTPSVARLTQRRAARGVACDEGARGGRWASRRSATLKAAFLTTRRCCAPQRALQRN